MRPLPKRDWTLKESGFVRSWTNEAYVGGSQGNAHIPLQEISMEDIQKIRRFVGTGGTTISKLAGFLGMHQQHAMELVELLLSLGVLRETGVNRIAVREDHPEVRKEVLNLSVFNEKDSTRSTIQRCEVFFTIEEGSIDIFEVRAQGENVLNRAFISKEKKTRLYEEGQQQKAALRVMKRGLFS